MLRRRVVVSQSRSNWSFIEAGRFTGFAIKTDGTLWAWGNGDRGTLGLNTENNYSSPKQVGLLTNWKTVSNNTVSQATFATKTDGTLWSWGWNPDGQLGLGNRTAYSSPKQVGSLTNWQVAIGGRDFAFAIKTDGTLWSWGLNSSGQLGLGNRTSYSSPKQVGSLTDWVTVAHGS